MRTFQIDPTLNNFPNPDPVSTLCWQAREILGGHMEEPCDFDEDHVLPVYGSEHDPDDDLSIHETTDIPLNRRQFVALSNMPYVFEEGEEPVPVIDPGYVALRVAPFPSEAQTRTLGKHPLDDQLIFRVPSLGSRAAIFHGWEMTPRLEVGRDNTKALRQIGNVLTFVQRSLRTLMEEDMETYEASYMSQVPRRAGGDVVSALLGDLFGDGLA